MGMIDDALQAMRTRLATIDPSPQRALVAAHVYPVKPVFKIDRLPVGIAHAAINRAFPVSARVVGENWWRWRMYVDILLAPGDLSTESLIAEANELYEPWVLVMGQMLAGNMTLGGTVHMIGDDRGGDFFIPRAAKLLWYNQWYWGVRFEIPIVQTWTRTVAQ